MISAAIELVFNIAILVALTLISGFIRQREDSSTREAVLQGLLFGLAAVIGMYRPMVLGPGLIFDGRSVVISVGALYFGPLAALVSAAVSLPYRLHLGGVGVLMGVLTIVLSAMWGPVLAPALAAPRPTHHHPGPAHAGAVRACHAAAADHHLAGTSRA